MGASLFTASMFIGFFSAIEQTILVSMKLTKKTSVIDVMITASKNSITSRTIIIMGFALTMAGYIVKPKLKKLVQKEKNNEGNSK